MSISDFMYEKLSSERYTQIAYSALSAATPDKIKTYQEALHYVGLDFHFKE